MPSFLIFQTPVQIAAPRRVALFLLGVMCFAPPLWATDLDSPMCREWPARGDIPSGAGVPYGQGVLWELRKGSRVNHILGTIHVSDADIKQLPRAVQQVLDKAKRLVLEVVPNPLEMTTIGLKMFDPSGGVLREELDEQLFARTVEILSQYHFSEQLTETFKPWAAYLTMSYPAADDPIILDLHLMQLANERGIEINGLETLEEQLNIFDNMPESKQVRLLVDTVCHYSRLEEDFVIMKDMYRARNLGGIHALVMQDVAKMQDALYDSLLDTLVRGRNAKMHNAMQEYLHMGDALVAMGAMHLPGTDGVLELLAKDGYQLKNIY